MSRKKVHFIGIGGIGISALAQYYLAMGWKVSGSDLVSSEITETLEKKGIKIFIGPHKAKNLTEDINLVVYSQAVSSKNPELKKAKRLSSKNSKLKIKSYPQALGELTKRYFTIAVSGTHGKSTTTAMIGTLLKKAGLDPTVILGTKVKEFQNSNCRIGKSKYLVIEADEYKASFLNYWPSIIVLTNIEKEHLDYYRNLNHILKTYRKYINHLPRKGTLVANRDDENIKKLLKASKNKFNIKEYSLTQKDSEKIKKILKIPGIHNVYNALAALSVARVLGIKDKISFQALSSYKGAWRRFEIKHSRIPSTNKKITIIDDYAHHPTELKATLEAVREKFPSKTIWVVFQPHQYQRTFLLFDNFVKVLSEAPVNQIILVDIYDVAGREKKSTKKLVSSKKLAEEIIKKNPSFSVLYIPEINETFEYIKKEIKNNTVLMIIGAGDIYKLSKLFSLDRNNTKLHNKKKD